MQYPICPLSVLCAPEVARRNVKHSVGIRKVGLPAIFLLALGLMSGTVARADSAVLTTLHTFTGSEGANPFAGLVQGADGDFYGTAYQGGANGSGTVFKLAPAGTLQTLYTFSATTWDPNAQTDVNADGNGPMALIQGADGDFYGVTPYGGLGGSGTIFKITPEGALATLHTFSAIDPYSQNNHDGAHPYAGLVQGADGDFYGTTHDGGANGYGTIFRITPRGGFDRLHTFSALDYNGLNKDGANPAAALVQGADGNLYGTTFWGGANGNGTVFKITPSGAFKVLYAFSAFTATSHSGYGINTDGANPAAGLVPGDDGSFYGIASYGGADGLGTVFQITPDGALTTLYSFRKRDGANPNALIRGADGNLYGTADQGGSQNAGAIFCLSPEGEVILLHDFTTALTNPNGTGWWNRDGSHPSGLVQGSDGNLYGTAYAGGRGGVGTVYRLTPALKLISASVSRDSTTGAYVATFTLQNTGYTTAPNVTILHSSLGVARGKADLPLYVGDMAAGTSISLTLTFPAWAGASGSVVPFRITATLTADRFEGARKVTLPPLTP